MIEGTTRRATATKRIAQGRAWCAISFFLLALGVYLKNVEYRRWGAAGDTTPAQLLPLALERNRDLTFDGLVNTESKGHWFEWRGGHWISVYPIVPGFFNVPTYWVAKRLGVPLDEPRRALLSVVTASIVTAAATAFFFLAVSRIVVRSSTAVVSTVVFGFATTAASVAARGLWQHGPSLLFLNAGVWMSCSRRPLVVALAGLPLGLAVWNRPVNLVIVAPLLVSSLLTAGPRAFVGLLAVIALPLTAMSLYSLEYWGSLLALGQYSPEGMFDGRFVEGLAGLLISPSRGLFTFTPLFLFSLPAALTAIRSPLRQPLLAALAVGPFVTLLIYSKWYSWWGGYTFGYRLLSECVPALTILAAVTWENLGSRRAIIEGLAVVAFGWSLYVHMLGAFFYPCGFNSIPNDIDRHTDRLWDWGDGEIERCTAKALRQLRTRSWR